MPNNHVVDTDQPQAEYPFLSPNMAKDFIRINRGGFIRHMNFIYVLHEDRYMVATNCKTNQRFSSVCENGEKSYPNKQAVWYLNGAAHYNKLAKFIIFYIISKRITK